MYTYQDFMAHSDKARFALEIIANHKASELYLTAVTADAYDHQKNTTINEFIKQFYTLSGQRTVDMTGSNTRIASNFFRNLNVQRCAYCLGKPVDFNDTAVKQKLGKGFDRLLYKAGYKALIHGVSFIYVTEGKCYLFKVTEFAPLYDEDTGALRAGVRFWQLATDKPLNFTVYEEDGYTSYQSDNGGSITLIQPKRGYKQITKQTQGGEVLEIDYENFNGFPIVPMYGSELKQSTLVGMQQTIDSYDLVKSGFANDVKDCAQIYWLINGADGMSEEELGYFRDKLTFNHIALGADGATVQPYTQDVPSQSRESILNLLRSCIYEDFGGLDVKSFATGGDKTTVEINSAYQCLDEKATDFEQEIAETIQRIFSLLGIEETDDTQPIFNRSKIVNEAEVVNMVMQEAPHLDEETILAKLPNIAIPEIQTIIENRAKEGLSRYGLNDTDGEVVEET